MIIEPDTRALNNIHSTKNLLAACGEPRAQDHVREACDTGEGFNEFNTM
jgi:hypothetical protein